MSNPTAPRSPLLWCTAVAVVAMAACGEAQKPGDAKPGVVQTAGKDGLSESLLAGELATAMVSGEGEKGVSSIGPGQSLQGTLANGDGKLDSGSYFDSWVFVLGEAADVSISMTSSDIDTYLSLYRGGPGSMGEYLGGDDDGGGDTNSRLDASLKTGTYSAVAHSYQGGETGAYSISLAISGAGGGDVGGGRILRPGQTTSGALPGGDGTFADGRSYEDWSFTGEAGERVTIDLGSGDFDTYLYVIRGGQELSSNDDSDGTNSSVSLTLPSSGVYTVRVSSYAAGASGSYSLSARSGGGTPTFTGFGTGGAPNGRYALLVGIDDYPGTDNDLRGPVEDTRIMERVLIEKFGFDPANVMTLRDADATRQNIAQGIALHLGQAGPDGVAVFFYSGHGTQIGENIGLTGSLDPEPRGEGDEAIYIYGHDFESAVILDEELGYLIETIDAGRALVVVDVCFSGEITRASGDAPQSKVVDLTDPDVAGSVRLPTDFITSEHKALNLTDMSLGFGDFSQIASVFENPQRHVAWGASTEDQISWTSSLGNGASVFTYYMGERMMAASGSATFAQINQAVHDDVVSYIEGNGNMTMQNPQMGGANQSMTLDDFFRQR